MAASTHRALSLLLGTHPRLPGRVGIADLDAAGLPTSPFPTDDADSTVPDQKQTEGNSGVGPLADSVKFSWLPPSPFLSISSLVDCANLAIEENAHRPSWKEAQSVNCLSWENKDLRIPEVPHNNARYYDACL